MSRQVVVVTGASGGIGRAVAQRVRRPRGHRRAGGPRRGGLDGRGRGRRAGRRHRARRCPADVADADAVFAAADQVETELGPDRRLGQRRVHLGVRPVRPDQARGVPAGDRGQLPRLRLRHDGRAEAHEAARPRAPSCRSVRRWPTAASRCRRAYCGAKHAIQGFHEALRCELLHEHEQRARDHGADAGGQHPAVLLGAVPAAAPRAAGSADLSARVRRPRRRCSPPTTRSDASTGSAPARRAHWPRTPSPRAAGPLPRHDRVQIPADAKRHDPERTGQPVGTGRRERRAGLRRPRHLRRPSHDRDPQLWASQHHGLVGLAAGAVAAAAGVTVRRVRRSSRGRSSASG